MHIHLQVSAQSNDNEHALSVKCDTRVLLAKQYSCESSGWESARRDENVKCVLEGRTSSLSESKRLL